MDLLQTTVFKLVVFDIPCVVPGNYTERTSQAGLLPCVSGHPHAQT